MTKFYYKKIISKAFCNSPQSRKNPEKKDDSKRSRRTTRIFGGMLHERSNRASQEQAIRPGFELSEVSDRFEWREKEKRCFFPRLRTARLQKQKKRPVLLLEVLRQHQFPSEQFLSGRGEKQHGGRGTAALVKHVIRGLIETGSSGQRQRCKVFTIEC